MPTNVDLATYLQSYSHTLTLVQYLANELYNHPQQKEIPLLGGQTGLTIPPTQAWAVIITYLRDNNLPSAHLRNLENSQLASRRKLEVVLSFLQDQERELPLANLAIEKNRLAYLASLEQKATNLDPSSPLQHAFAIQRNQIKKYHESLHTLQGIVFGENATEQLAKRESLATLLPPHEILTDQELQHVQEKLISLLPSLATTATLTSISDSSTLYRTLTRLASKDPALSKFVAFNASNTQKTLLANLVGSTAQAYHQQTGQPISALEQAQHTISNQNLSSLALPRAEAEKMLTKILTDQGIMPPDTATAFTAQLFTESVLSAYTLNRPVTAQALVTSALAKLSLTLDSSQSQNLIQASTPVFADLLTHNQTQILEARNLGYVPGPFSYPKLFLPTEVKLALATHTDPAIHSIDYDKSLQKLLQQYQVNDLVSLRQQATTDNNLNLLSSLAFLDNYQAQITKFRSSLTTSQKFSYGFIRTKNGLGHGLISYQKFTTKKWDQLFAFQEKLNKHNPIALATNWWVNTEEKIMATNWGWALNPVSKAVQIFDAWREKAVGNLLQKYKLNPPKTVRGHFLNWATQMYYQGGFTVGGFINQSTIWGARYLYDLAKTGAKKLGKVILKKVSLLAIKILGEAVAEQIFGSILPGIGNVLAVIGTVVGVVKALWQNRELILQYGKKALLYLAGIGFAIYSFIAALVAKLGAAIIASTIGALIGLPFGLSVPLGAIGGLIGFNLGAITAALSSIASFGSAIMSGLAAAGGQIVLFGAGILGVTYLTTLTVITAQTTAEIPNPNSTGETPGIIAPYTGPVYDGCVETPPTSGPVIQGPHGPGSHATIEALDIYVEDGSAVYSIRAGTVTHIDNNAVGSVYGKRIDISYTLDNGTTFTAIYAHLQNILVSLGPVSSGQQIATSDSTSSKGVYRNPHLHFGYVGIRYGFCPIPGADANDVEGCYNYGGIPCNSSI